MAQSHDKAGAPRAFELARTFDAPLPLVWQAWSEAERLQEWWGPKGCRLEVARLEFRPGGFFHYAMQYSGNAPPMWGRFMYREISPSHRLVWLNSFSNAECGIARAPFEQLLPLEIENTVTFTERDGATTVALRALPFGATDAECQVFDGMFASLENGYGGTLSQLAGYLARAGA